MENNFPIRSNKVIKKHFSFEKPTTNVSLLLKRSLNSNQTETAAIMGNYFKIPQDSPPSVDNIYIYTGLCFRKREDHFLILKAV